MDVRKKEVTLYHERYCYRDFTGVNREALRIKRLAKVVYPDGTEAFCPIDIEIDDAPHSTTEAEPNTVFFLERNDVRDNGNGEVVNEVLAEGTV